MRGLAMLALTLTLAFVGCGGGESTPRYQIVPAGEGKAYRLDTETGDVWYIDGRVRYQTRTEEEWLREQERQ